MKDHESLLDVEDCLFWVVRELGFGCIAYEAFIWSKSDITRRNPISHVIGKDLMPDQYELA